MFFRKHSRPIEKMRQQDNFSQREVGLNHPDSSAFVRLLDNGDVEISAGSGLSILMHVNGKSITFVADHVNFLTRDVDGIRWNRLSFNERATVFQEPALNVMDEQDMNNPYKGTEGYLDG